MKWVKSKESFKEKKITNDTLNIVTVRLTLSRPDDGPSIIENHSPSRPDDSLSVIEKSLFKKIIMN